MAGPNDYIHNGYNYLPIAFKYAHVKGNCN